VWSPPHVFLDAVNVAESHFLRRCEHNHGGCAGGGTWAGTELTLAMALTVAGRLTRTVSVLGFEDQLASAMGMPCLTWNDVRYYMIGG
jgi:hypothetical protein